MILVWSLFAATAGLVIASVIWVVADKQIRGSGPNLQASCLSCGQDRGMRFWLPLRWMGSHGRCPHCGDDDRTRRRWELAVGAYAVAAFALLDTDSRLRLLLATLPLLLILAVDLKAQAVFLVDCYLGVIVGLFLGLSESPAMAASAMAGMGIALVVCLVFLVIMKWVLRSLGVATSPIGVSDVYVAAAMGAIVRADGLLPALVAAVTGAAFYGTVLPLVRPAARGRLAPFGPFLCMGGLLALVI